MHVMQVMQVRKPDWAFRWNRYPCGRHKHPSRFYIPCLLDVLELWLHRVRSSWNGTATAHRTARC